MALTKAAIVGGAAREAREILGAVPGVAADIAAQYVKQGTPSGLIPNLGVALARQACRRHAQQPNLAPDRVSAGLERICRPYLDDIGYGAGPALDLPFRGGQCAITYFVNITVTSYATDGSVDSSGPSQVSVLGPVGGLSFSNSGCGPVLGPLAAGAQGFCMFISGGNGTQLVAGNGNGGLSGSITSVVPAAAVPDNCGNPPVVVVPPTTPPGPVINIEPIIVVPILDIDADVTINVDGTIDITIDDINVTIDPFDEGDGDGGDGDGGDPGDPTDPGTPGDPEGTGAGGEAEGEAPPGQELVGVLVTVSQAPGDANKFANNPKQPFRGIGYVRMGYPGRLGLDISGGTVISPQFFHAQQRGLTNWEVAANTGFSLTVVPYYREIES